jgi:hypothetical protein
MKSSSANGPSCRKSNGRQNKGYSLLDFNSLDGLQAQLESNLRFLETHGAPPAAIDLLHARIMKVIVALTKLQTHHMEKLMNKDAEIIKILEDPIDARYVLYPHQYTSSSNSGFILPSNSAISAMTVQSLLAVSHLCA